MSKEFLEELNKMIAPVTKAWKDFEIVRIAIDHEGFGVDNDNEMVVDVRLLLKKGESI